MPVLVLGLAVLWSVPGAAQDGPAVETVLPALEALSAGDLSVLQGVVQQGGADIMTVEGSGLDGLLGPHQSRRLWQLTAPPEGMPPTIRQYEVTEAGAAVLKAWLTALAEKRAGVGQPRGPRCAGPDCQVFSAGCGEIVSGNPPGFRRSRTEIQSLVAFSVGFYAGHGVPVTTGTDLNWVRTLFTYCAENPTLAFTEAMIDTIPAGAAAIQIGQRSLTGAPCSNALSGPNVESFAFYLAVAMGYWTVRVSDTGADPDGLMGRKDIFPALSQYCEANPDADYLTALASTIPGPLP